MAQTGITPQHDRWDAIPPRCSDGPDRHRQ